MKPKIKPKRMWGIINKHGYPVAARLAKYFAEQIAQRNFGETVRRVLVTEPPKRRKRK